MPNTNKNRRQVKKSSPPALKAVPTARIYVEDFTATQMKEALLPLNQLACPLDEMIATAEAAFEFMRGVDVDRSTIRSLCQIEKLFDFYKNLVEMAVPGGLRIVTMQDVERKKINVR
jgi:hypothetical protein